MAVQIWIVSVAVQSHSGVSKNLPQKLEYGNFRPIKRIIGGLMGDQQRIVFINGKFLPEAEASLPIFDRGLLFADAVYEGFGILDGQIVDFIYHMQRLEQSLAKIEIPATFTTDSMFADLMRLIEKMP